MVSERMYMDMDMVSERRGSQRVSWGSQLSGVSLAVARECRDSWVVCARCFALCFASRSR